MALTSGLQLGPYKVLSSLGAGGMGEVYRARDTTLGRDVAIKILPDAFVNEPDRLARFELEAHLLASLNHPNIAAIYGLAEHEALRFLVLELVPGETLADRLTHGPLPVTEALGLMRQLAEALEAAHERGIIHRDLKPGNLKVTPEGKLKVLDFGLGKALTAEGAAVDHSQSPTLSHGGSAGVLLGTAPYMSPEQARGKPVDKRTDIWSFGCVAYETLTGRSAFRGETVSDTIAAILDREPHWEALPAETPALARSLLRRCLQKERSQRLHDIADARIEIDEALSGPDRTLVSSPRPGRARRMVELALAVAAGALASRLALPPRKAGPVAPTLTGVARLTHDPGFSEWPTWSPDGALLAFASSRSGDFEIYVRRIEGGQEVNVTDDPGQDFQPAFSPDGKSLAFVSTRSSRTGLIKIGAQFGFEFRTYGGDLWVTPALGGRARRVAQDANFPVWRPDGRRIVYVSGPEGHRSILEVDPDGGAPRPLLASDASTWEILRLQPSPGGRWISFETPDESIWLTLAEGGTPRELLRGSNHVWEASGRRIHYLSRDPLGGTRLQSVLVDEGTGELRGAAQTIGLMTGILRDLAISRDGRQVAATELEGALNLTRLPLMPGGGAPGGPEEVLSAGQVIDRYPAFSPDGRRIAFSSDRLGPQQLWILDLETLRPEPFQLPGEDSGASLPRWFPDGKRLSVVRSFKDGTRVLWAAALDGSHAAPLRSAAPDLQAGSVSPDGKTVAYSARAGSFLQVFVLELDGGQERQLTTSPGDKYADPAAWSPDGRWIAYASNVGGTMQIWRIPASGGKEQALTSGHERMRHPAYSPDGRWLYVQPSHRNIYRLPADGGPLQAVTRFPDAGLFLEEPTVSPDGRSLVYCRSNGGSSLWRLTLDPGPEPAR